MGEKALAARGRLGSVSRRHPEDSSAIVAAKRDLAIAKIEDYVTKVVAESPPLTDDQRARLTALLGSGGLHAS